MVKRTIKDRGPDAEVWRNIVHISPFRHRHFTTQQGTHVLRDDEGGRRQGVGLGPGKNARQKKKSGNGDGQNVMLKEDEL